MVVNVLPRIKGSKTFWAFDTEYIAAGLKAQDDVCNFGFANNFGESYVFRKPEQVRDFIARKRFQSLYVWCMLPEFGSLASWSLLGVHFNKNPLLAVDVESPSIHRFEIERSDSRITKVYDVQGYFKVVRWKDQRLAKLEGMAKYLSSYYQDPSLVKVEMKDEDWFGIRKPETKEEWRILDDRVRQDALVTAKAVEFLEQVLIKKLIVEPHLNSYWSWGTIARKFFQFPQTYLSYGKETCIPTWHKKIQDATFAGRSECFSIGLLPPCYYEDVASLYPVATVASNALMLEDVEALTRSELEGISKPSDFHPYAWLFGDFESSNDLWGLPVRSEQRNYYVTGTVRGLYNTMDLEASHATIKQLFWGLKPIFRSERTMHETYAALTMKKLEKEYEDDIEKEAIKGVLNASTGSLGQCKPKPSVRSNFPAYNAILAKSHLIMSQIFDLAPKPIHYTDTDSLFVEARFEGKQFEVRDVEEKIIMPVILDQKAFGETPRVFRSKHYYLDDENLGFHAIHLGRKEWLRIVTTLPDKAVVNQQIRGTLLTRSSRAKQLQLGRWYECQLAYDLKNLEELFHADNKRQRVGYDSYTLCRFGKFIGSRAWTMDEFTTDLQLSDAKDTILKLPSGSLTSRDYLKLWRKEFAQHEQSEVKMALLKKSMMLPFPESGEEPYE